MSIVWADPLPLFTESFERVNFPLFKKHGSGSKVFFPARKGFWIFPPSKSTESLPDFYLRSWPERLSGGFEGECFSRLRSGNFCQILKILVLRVIFRSGRPLTARVRSLCFWAVRRLPVLCGSGQDRDPRRVREVYVHWCDVRSQLAK